MNVFIHLTYDGEVDVDAITDPIMRDATIAQINNFGNEQHNHEYILRPPLSTIVLYPTDLFVHQHILEIVVTRSNAFSIVR